MPHSYRGGKAETPRGRTGASIDDPDEDDSISAIWLESKRRGREGEGGKQGGGPDSGPTGAGTEGATDRRLDPRPLGPGAGGGERGSRGQNNGPRSSRNREQGTSTSKRQGTEDQRPPLGRGSEGKETPGEGSASAAPFLGCGEPSGRARGVHTHGRSRIVGSLN